MTSTTLRASGKPRRQLRDNPVDVRLILSALWVSTLVVFAYVDIFGFFRADVLVAAMDGRVATTGFSVDQVFLLTTTAYIIVPALMVVLSLVIRPRALRVITIVTALLYLVSIVVSCIGETWIYYIVGSAVEVVLLAVMVRVAWLWPAANSTERVAS